MAEKDKKYYWLKLKRDFFKRHDIQIIEDMPNGKDYILFYLKLLCESVDHEGNLRFSDEIPYNDQMLATITRTNIDIVRSAIKVFSQLKMIEIYDNGTYYMKEVEKLIGSETYWAEKKRVQREEKKLLTNKLDTIGQCPTSPSKSKSKSIDKDKEKDINISKDNSLNDIFEFWNSKGIIKHGELSKEMENQITKSIKKYGIDKVKEYIDRYSKVYHDKTYFFKQKWTLVEFLKQSNAISSFTDEGSKWLNYLENEKTKSSTSNQQQEEKPIKKNWYDIV